MNKTVSILLAFFVLLSAPLNAEGEDRVLLKLPPGLTFVPQQDRSLLKRLPGSKVVPKHEGRNEKYNFYFSIRKHLTGKPLIQEVHIYGIEDPNEIKQLLLEFQAYANRTLKLKWIEVKFFQEENLVSYPNGTTRREKEVLLKKTKLYKKEGAKQAR